VSSWSINFLSIAMGLVSYFLLPMAVYTVLFTPSAITRIQFMRLARQSGIYKYERYIDASAHKNWLADARNWVRHGITPA
jgi:hypothetical protein